MRRVRYVVAMSLDGYIAGPDDEFDWIVMDPELDFTAMMSGFDTVLMGRRTFEVTSAHSGEPASESMPGMKTIVASNTLRQEDYPHVTIIGPGLEEAISRLRAEPGKDIWLFGGGVLFRSLLEARLVDTVEIGVMPVLLGAGRPLLPSPAGQVGLRLTGSRVYEKTGTVSLEYAMQVSGE